MTSRDVVLVFGEDHNDARAVKELVLALRPGMKVRVEARKKPIVFFAAGVSEQKKRKNVDEIAAVCRAEAVRNNVKAVVVHKDCDAVEPAHERVGEALELALARSGVPNPVAAVAAWEIEAWWMLFPKACVEHRPCWKRMNSAGKDVGLVQNAKEELRRALRSSPKCPDYSESDSEGIARSIRELKIAFEPEARSGSWKRFIDKLQAVDI